MRTTTPILHMYPYYNQWECNWLFSATSAWQVVSSPINWIQAKSLKLEIISEK